jgi:hypothetical protein
VAADCDFISNQDDHALSYLSRFVVDVAGYPPAAVTPRAIVAGGQPEESSFMQHVFIRLPGTGVLCTVGPAAALCSMVAPSPLSS